METLCHLLSPHLLFNIKLIEKSRELSKKMMKDEIKAPVKACAIHFSLLLRYRVLYNLIWNGGKKDE